MPARLKELIARVGLQVGAAAVIAWRLAFLVTVGGLLLFATVWE